MFVALVCTCTTMSSILIAWKSVRVCVCATLTCEWRTWKNVAVAIVRNGETFLPISCLVHFSFPHQKCSVPLRVHTESTSNVNPPP